MPHKIHSDPGKDLFWRGDTAPPVFPGLENLADDPEKLRDFLFSGGWTLWLKRTCGDGRFDSIVSSAVNTYNAGCTDQMSTLGGPNQDAFFIREGRSMDYLHYQLEFAHKHHSVVGVQLVTHSLCGATKDEVIDLVPGAAEVYAHPTKVPVGLFFRVLKIEADLHRRDCETVRDWILDRCPFITTVELLRSTKFVVRPLSRYEAAIKRALATIEREKVAA